MNVFTKLLSKYGKKANTLKISLKTAKAKDGIEMSD